MQKLIIFLSLYLGAFGNVDAQGLYMPRNIQMAYQNETRSLDGKPGIHYWQNKGIYNVQVTVHPESATLSGTEQIVYYNNSPDTLSTIAIRFVNNTHKPTSPRAYHESSPDYFTTGLEISSLKIDGQLYETDAASWSTVKELKLQNPILPKSKAAIDIVWSYPFSKKSDREGRIDSTTFFAGYSYPRISVYDDYNGWDMLEHNGQQEFYNDFNDYTFAITVPKDYIVWATGNFLNPDEVLQPPIAKRLKASQTSDDVISVASLQEVLGKKVTQQKNNNTWKFSYEHITDFTFAVSDHYVWDAGSVIVDTHTGRRASMQAAYNPTAKEFESAVSWGKNTLQYYSQKLPGFAYPYPTMTAFNGHGAMEFPMMVNDVTVPHDLVDARMLQDHEISHTYFPFYMGTNETRYGFMDEGWAVFFTYVISCDLFGKEVGDRILKNTRIGRWSPNTATEMDMPLITMSSQLTGSAYRNITYNKSVTAYLALQSLLGEKLFKSALLHYMNTWQGKHPMPWDFFYNFNTAAKMDLNWFWNNWFFSNYYIDLAIKEVQIEGKNVSVSIANKGGLYIPATLKVYFDKGTIFTEDIKVEDWHNDPTKTITFDQASNAKVIKVEIDNGVFVDATSEDNVWQK